MDVLHFGLFGAHFGGYTNKVITWYNRSEGCDSESHQDRARWSGKELVDLFSEKNHSLKALFSALFAPFKDHKQVISYTSQYTEMHALYGIL